tara:strand:+ start:1487 stop:1687 length:201 start_codon:yes stop_codon:yes gene_type:complete
VISTLTLVELPGTEKLAEDRTELYVTEGTLANRSITQMSELVRATSARLPAFTLHTPAPQPNARLT